MSKTLPRCARCHKVIRAKKPRKFHDKFVCSKVCENTARTRHHKGQPIADPIRNCLRCHGEFQASNLQTLYCSNACKETARTRRYKGQPTGDPIRNCLRCHKEFQAHDLQMIYCSNNCMAKHSQENDPHARAKQAARNRLHWAITKGEHPRADQLLCFMCDDAPAQNHHHCNTLPVEYAYTQGYDQTIPLCDGCHNQLHATIKNGKELTREQALTVLGSELGVLLTMLDREANSKLIQTGTYRYIDDPA